MNVSYAQERYVHFPDDTVSYLWPTNASQQLSSTFAETRSAHLHSGIDIRTWGREGYNVFASRDGYIYRIATGPHGYGNVIYMKHPDNTYTIYAHLNRFEDELQSYTDSIRMIDYSFEIDKLLEEDKFRFNRGDVIGYTGSTGVGPPHLHFEIRNSDFKPINPLLTNLSVADDLPPVFSQIAVEFLNNKTLHRTGHTILQLKEADSENIFHFGEFIANGPIGLAVNVHDRANNTPNVYAVHSLKLIVESDTLFHATADHFSFRDTKNMFLDRSYPILAQTRRGFQRLYVVEGNRLPFYQKTKNSGVLSFNDGTYRVTIIAKDIYGNESRATLDITYEDTSANENITYVPAYPLFQAMNYQRLHRWNAGQIPFEKSLLVSTSSDFSFFQNQSGSHYFSFTEKVARKKLSPAKMEVISTSDEKLWLQFPSSALYDTLDIKLRVLEQEDQIDISFNPTQLPLDSPFRFNYILPEKFKDKNRLALFSVDHTRGRESFINADISKGMVRADINSIRDLRIKEDRIAPWAGRPRLEKNIGGKYVIILPTVDQSTGIDYRKSIITVNNVKGIIVYDPDKDFLIYYNPFFIPKSHNIIEYSVYDGAGNKATGSHSIQYLN